MVTVTGPSSVHGLTMVIGSSQQPRPDVVKVPCGLLPGSTAFALPQVSPWAQTPGWSRPDMHTTVDMGAALPLQALGVTDATIAVTPPVNTAGAAGDSSKEQ
ncbi:hypothetical protein MHAS_03006 [Mycolicibacterium hassiacum DSM 44199]|nr:hypothetical protein MHAS_03006 [Mycolicibacterium hassiacum DSM 44199]